MSLGLNARFFVACAARLFWYFIDTDVITVETIRNLVTCRTVPLGQYNLPSLFCAEFNGHTKNSKMTLIPTLTRSRPRHNKWFLCLLVGLLVWFGWLFCCCCCFGVVFVAIISTYYFPLKSLSPWIPQSF